MIDCIKLDCDEEAMDNSNYCAEHREKIFQPKPKELLTGREMMADIMRWFK